MYGYLIPYHNRLNCCLPAHTQPSQVGIELSSITFTTFTNGAEIATVASTSAFTLSPESTSPLPLAGRLIPQSSEDGLAAISAVFNNFIHGLDSNIEVQGASAGPNDVCLLYYFCLCTTEI